MFLCLAHAASLSYVQEFSKHSTCLSIKGTQQAEIVRHPEGLSFQDSHNTKMRYSEVK